MKLKSNLYAGPVNSFPITYTVLMLYLISVGFPLGVFLSMLSSGFISRYLGWPWVFYIFGKSTIHGLTSHSCSPFIAIKFTYRVCSFPFKYIYTHKQAYTHIYIYYLTTLRQYSSDTLSSNWKVPMDIHHKEIVSINLSHSCNTFPWPCVLGDHSTQKRRGLESSYSHGADTSTPSFHKHIEEWAPKPVG